MLFILIIQVKTLKTQKTRVEEKVEEKAQQLRALAIFTDMVLVPAPLVTPVPEDVMPFSSLHRNQAHTWCSGRQVNTALTKGV